MYPSPQPPTWHWGISVSAEVSQPSGRSTVRQTDLSLTPHGRSGLQHSLWHHLYCGRFHCSPFSKPIGCGIWVTPDLKVCAFFPQGLADCADEPQVRRSCDCCNSCHPHLSKTPDTITEWPASLIDMGWRAWGAGSSLSVWKEISRPLVPSFALPDVSGKCDKNASGESYKQWPEG